MEAWTGDRRGSLTRLVLPGFAALALVACGDDDPTGPDREPPVVEILSAPSTAQRNEPVEISYRVTDDVRLSTIGISWGAAGAPIEIRFPTGRAEERTASHTYADPGSYRITVSATDARGRMASDFVMTTVE